MRRTMRSGPRPRAPALHRNAAFPAPRCIQLKTQTKIYVDRLAGLPLAWLLNIAARILGKLLRRDHSVTPRMSERS